MVFYRGRFFNGLTAFGFLANLVIPIVAPLSAMGLLNKHLLTFNYGESRYHFN